MAVVCSAVQVEGALLWFEVGYAVLSVLHFDAVQEGSSFLGFSLLLSLASSGFIG